MKGYISNIEELTKRNKNFRQVLYTGKYSQLVLMSLKPEEEIGEEVHADVDQFFRFESGSGLIRIDGVEHVISDGFAVVVPAGALHNVINNGDQDLKLYTIYSPPEHLDGIVRETKDQAEAQPEHFDGRTTE